MARVAINAGKGGRTKVPTPGLGASFVAGSRPTSLRAPAVPRIKPSVGQRDYGKADPPETGFGLTGVTSRS